MVLKSKDFIEIKFTGKTEEGEIFDSNIEEDLKKSKKELSEINSKSFIFCLGEGMFLKGVDNFLIGKEIGNYEINLKPEEAFGKRQQQLVQIIPMKIFKEQKLNPFPGAIFNFDGKIARVLTVSGGRILVDFNNPLAGKTVNYKLNVLRKVEDLNEKVKALIDFFFRRNLKFEIKDKKIILEVDKQISKFVELFKDKFKELLDLEIEIKEIENKENLSKVSNKQQ
jgi:peptidylprolyl isomerase